MSYPPSASDPAPSAATSGVALPVAALLLATFAMASSPLLVRAADVGPFASAFWRVGGALPVLWLWASWEARQAGKPARSAFGTNAAILLTGIAFAGDLLVWHLAILKTTIANATFFATMSPIWVVMGSWVLIGEKVGRGGFLGVLICLLGAVAILGSSYSFAPNRLEGDFYGIATSAFFGAYFLALRAARRRSGTGRIIFLTSFLAAVLLLVVALLVEGRILPDSMKGLAAILGLAYFSHAAGQGLLTYASGHVPAVFSSLVTLLGSLIAATLAWIFLAEAMMPIQILGGALILFGIYVARPVYAGS